jgi:nucleoside 2-deoxyribosyltransferase
MKRNIYLAGPIAGLKESDANKWRNIVKDALCPDIDCFSPLRGKDFVPNENGVYGEYYETQDQPFNNDRSIMRRDFDDVKKADLIFCYLKGSEKVSKGTIMELGWAYAMQKLVVAVIEPKGNIHEHGMVRETFSYRFDNLDDAIVCARIALLT